MSIDTRKPILNVSDVSGRARLRLRRSRIVKTTNLGKHEKKKMRRPTHRTTIDFDVQDGRLIDRS